MTRIACHQLAPKVGCIDDNRAVALEAIVGSVADGAQIVVVPELVTSGYVFESAEEARSVSVRGTDDLFGEWARAAGPDAIVVGGFAELSPDGLLYNSAAVVDHKGVLAIYRKTHLWDREKLWFTPGSAAPPIVETPFGRIAVLICYDLEFPEMTRSVALAGADLIVTPTNWPLVERPDGERPPEVTIAMAAARVNHVAIACCDRSGVERGQAWTEGTTIVDEQGWVVATAGASGVAVAELDLRRARDKTMTPLCDAFGDRRPELYGALAGPAR